MTLTFNRRDVTRYPDLERALSSAVYFYNRLILKLRALGKTRFTERVR
ncbi:hypothetical protein [Paraburkholderia sp. RL17-381-BIF-C]